ncbi:glycosyltransferase family 4 protein [Paenibacillus sp. IB182496]|uniref:Glycosyltransferase family 4 protein n=1 Tax=Paenibacillus sabuli TaxID=2772509 RepID=A0A927BU94_9BACL|nr:glycosyltransferase family 4 protein [Paenibacillus sabuli]MBD2846427.1 glycosyltransferase family 4 protein [Paenibacillus sabuli]
MKFTFPILTLCKGGAQRMLAEIVNGLTQRGHEVVVLMPLGGVVEYPLHARLVSIRRHELRASDYPVADYIISNYYLTVPSAKIASAQKKGKHIRLSLCYEPVFLADNHISLPTYHMTDKLLVLSSWQQQLLQLLHGIQPRIVQVGIRPIFRNLNIRIGRRRLVIGAIVRMPEGFASHRDQHYLLAQLERIRQLFAHVDIHLITPPGELAASPQLQRIQAEGKFRLFTPAGDEELCHCYNHADIFVTSSFIETANLPGLEAMRCGCALVATYAGGNTDYARHMQNCLMSYRHQHLLFSQLALLIRNTELRHRLAREGEREAAKWTWERSLAQFEQAVRQL